MASDQSVLWHPDSESTRTAARLFRECDILFLLGPSGTGKTHTALGLGLPFALNKRKKVFVSRPMVEAGEESIGYLPGDADEKFSPYFAPFSDCLSSMTFAKPQVYREWFEPVPLAFMRGRNFDSVVILDEAQNCTLPQLKLAVTRLCVGGKMIVTGDPRQCDIPDSGLVKAVQAIRDEPGVGLVIFNSARDNRRHPILPGILKRWPSTK